MGVEIAVTNSLSPSGGWLEPATIVNVVLVLLTLAAVGAAFTQAAISSGTARRQLRAYVGIAEVNMAPLDSREGVRVSIKFRNFGQTPAEQLQILLETRVGNQPPDRPPGGFQSLAPGAEINVPTDFEGEAEQLDRLHAGDIPLTMKGVANYRDIFGRAHSLPFALTYDAALRAMGQVSPSAHGT